MNWTTGEKEQAGKENSLAAGHKPDKLGEAGCWGSSRNTHVPCTSREAVTHLSTSPADVANGAKKSTTAAMRSKPTGKEPDGGKEKAGLPPSPTRSGQVAGRQWPGVSQQ